MKLIYTILFFIYFSASAETYYVANAGSDGAAGTGEGSAWQTIAKVNSFTFVPGDNILFKAGDSWNEKLLPPSSGSSGSVITFGSYGTGVKPIITGLQSLSLSDQGSNIWTATATNSVKNLNTVLIGGVIRAKGRYPNTTFLTYSTSTQFLINTALTGTPDYTGGEVVVRSYSWLLDRSTITSQSGGTLNMSPGLSYATTGGGYYFIQNLPSVLDIQNEWCYDSTTKLLTVFSTSSPTVHISTIDTLVFMNHKDYITFDGLSFTGGNKITLGFDTSTHVTIQNCSFNNSGGNAIHHSSSTYTIISKDSILNTLNNAIWTYYISHNCTVDSNYISKAGMLQGMGASGNLAAMAMHNYGNSSITTNNRIDSIGYIAVFFNGTNSLVQHNYITNFALSQEDAGAIYTNGGIEAGSIVRSNIIVNGLGTYLNHIAAGIYMDFNSTGVTVDSNTIYNCRYAGILFNTPNNIILKSNTVVNGIGAAFYYAVGGGSNFTIRDNIYYSTDSTQVVYYNAYGTNNGTLTGYNSDSNYFMRPLKETDLMQVNNGYYSIASFYTATGWDQHSFSTPSEITGEGVLHINPTLSSVVVPITGRWKDARGILYDGLITIAPFQSALLFNTTIQPEVKIRVGNLIFN